MKKYIPLALLTMVLTSAFAFSVHAQDYYTICPDQNSRYDGGTGCKCKDGYLVDSHTRYCTPVNTLCQSEYGSNSFGDSSGNCSCDPGYVISNGTCTFSNPYGQTTKNPSSISSQTFIDNIPLRSCPNPLLKDQLADAEKLDLQLPKVNLQKAYDVYTTQRKDQPIGTLPDRYSSYNPLLRTDVVDSATDIYGDIHKKFSDGTYAFFDNYGNYSHSGDTVFNNAKNEIGQINDTRTGAYLDARNSLLQISEAGFKSIKSSICNDVERAISEKNSQDARFQSFINLSIATYPDAGITGDEKTIEEVNVKVLKSPSWLAKQKTLLSSTSSNPFAISSQYSKDGICITNFSPNSYFNKNKNQCACEIGYIWGVKDSSSFEGQCIEKKLQKHQNGQLIPPTQKVTKEVSNTKILSVNNQTNTNPEPEKLKWYQRFFNWIFK